MKQTPSALQVYLFLSKKLDSESLVNLQPNLKITSEMLDGFNQEKDLLVLPVETNFNSFPLFIRQVLKKLDDAGRILRLKFVFKASVIKG